jgi:23S rRNA (uridine2552-2'-O)-methyltransferase
VAQQRKLHDKFFKQAKAEGYAARSAYKLKEIQERHRLIRRGMRVIDLGCAPGSWTQVACELVGPGGRVLGADLQEVTIPLPAQARTIVADAFKLTHKDLLDLMDGPADVVLSDMAPNTTGDPGGDHFRSVELCRRVLALLPEVLILGGGLAMKVFEGEDYPRLLRETQAIFSTAKGLKPEATRGVSREMFIIGEGYTGQAPPAERASAKLAPARPAPKPGWNG